MLSTNIGLAASFALNAASHLVIFGTLLLWWPAATSAPWRYASLFAEMGAGLRHVRRNPAILAKAMRAMALFLFASACWSLLPLIARVAARGGFDLSGADGTDRDWCGDWRTASWHYQIALVVATAGLGPGIRTTWRFKVGQGDALDPGPASAWPQAPAIGADPSDDRATMVIVE
jgi:hypothetical protein